MSPEVTLAQLIPLLDRARITRIANITGLDDIGLPVVSVIRPESRSVSVAQGKGLTLEAAKVSGIMEALENFHAERVRAPLRLASPAEMAGEGAVLDLLRVPRVEGGILSEHVRCLWMNGHDVLTGRGVWLPYELVHTDYTVPTTGATGALLISDSGVAAGNTPVEAFVHAVCELVERDAVTLWAYAPEPERRARRLRLDSVDDCDAQSVLVRFARAGLITAVWDITSDTGVPAYHCTIVDGTGDPWRRVAPASGTGCHPGKEVALLRALTEAAQSRLTLIAGSRDDLALAAYARRRSAEHLAAERARLLGEPEVLSFDERASEAHSTLEADAAWLVERLVAVGVRQLAVADLTLPEINVPVVRVVAPGLEALCDAAGYAPGERVRKACR